METIAAHYDMEAQNAGIYIVSSCGFDCIPNDLGALLLQRTFNGDLAYVESYMSVNNGVRLVHLHRVGVGSEQPNAHPPWLGIIGKGSSFM